MFPLLLTLYGEADETSMILAIITAAIANVVKDVQGVTSGNEDFKTAILNTMVPYVGDVVGSYWWPKTPDTEAAAGPANAVNTGTGVAIAIVGASVLLMLGGTVYSFVKENKND